MSDRRTDRQNTDNNTPRTIKDWGVKTLKMMFETDFSSKSHFRLEMEFLVLSSNSHLHKPKSYKPPEYLVKHPGILVNRGSSETVFLSNWYDSQFETLESIDASNLESFTDFKQDELELDISPKPNTDLGVYKVLVTFVRHLDGSQRELSI